MVACVAMQLQEKRDWKCTRSLLPDTDMQSSSILQRLHTGYWSWGNMCFTWHSLGEIRFKTKLNTKQMSLFIFGCLCVLLWSLARSWPHHTIPANIKLAVKRLFHLLSKSILAFFWNLPWEPVRSPKTHFQKTYCMCLLPRKQSEVAFISAHTKCYFLSFGST